MNQHFNTLCPPEPDSIVAAAAKWQAFLEAHPGAVNLTIGVIIDPETMQPYRPPTVQQAYDKALEQAKRHVEYGYHGPIGNPHFLARFGAFAFGPEYEANADDTLAYQTLGGTGALWMAQEMLAKLIRRDDTDRVPLLLDPGYGNHTAIFSSDRFNITTYPYVDPATDAYNHAAALAAVLSMPPHSVALLQVCGHNNTGADRTKQQWDEILDAAQSREVVLVLDGAYLGLARGLADDVYPLRECRRRGLLTFACLSTSKIMGLYGERLGALYVLNARQHLGDTQFGHLDTLYRAKVRQTITGVPDLVAAAADTALQNPAFVRELEATRLRVLDNRAAFSAGAGKMVVGAATGWGIYSLARQDGFSSPQIDALNAQGLYVLDSSRINYGGMRDLRQAQWIGEVVANVLSRT